MNGEMTGTVPVPRGPARRRRMDGGRARVLKVRVSDQELTAIRGKAARLRVSPQRLLIESAMAGSARSAVEWRALFEEVVVVRRLLAALGNNVNQLARVANATGEPPVLDAPLEMVTRVLARTDATLAALRPPSS